MITAEELRKVIDFTNVVLEDLLYETVQTLSLERPGANVDPQVAFSQLLSQNLPKVKDITKTFNVEKLFTSKNKRTLQTKIDIRNLDSGLVIPLLKIEEILGIKRNPGQCTNPTHKKQCCEDCALNCDHTSPTCKKCQSQSGGTRAKSCKHDCRNCKRSLEQCASESKICCKVCKICMDCNEDLAKLEMSFRSRMAVTSVQQPCATYLVWFCLDILLKWRNLFAHKTTQQLELFINGTKLMKDFESCQNSEQLMSFLKTTFLVLMDYLSDKRIFKAKPLHEYKHQKLNKDLEDIFTCGARQMAYLEKNYIELSNLLERTISLRSM